MEFRSNSIEVGNRMKPSNNIQFLFQSFLLCTLSLLLLFVNEINILNRILNSKALLENQNISFSCIQINGKYEL